MKHRIAYTILLLISFISIGGTTAALQKNYELGERYSKELKLEQTHYDALATKLSEAQSTLTKVKADTSKTITDNVTQQQQINEAINNLGK